MYSRYNEKKPDLIMDRRKAIVDLRVIDSMTGIE
jgi:hypothetical protein